MYTLRRGSRVTFTRTLSDPSQGLEIPLTLRKLGVMDQVRALDEAEAKIQQYVTGMGDPGKPGYVPPALLPPIDGQPVLVSPTTCRVASLVSVAQVVSESDRYSWEEIVSLMAVDTLCAQITALSSEVQEQEASPDPLALTPSEAASSPTAAAGEPPAIPA